MGDISIEPGFLQGQGRGGGARLRPVQVPEPETGGHRVAPAAFARGAQAGVPTPPRPACHSLEAWLSEGGRVRDGAVTAVGRGSLGLSVGWGSHGPRGRYGARAAPFAGSPRAGRAPEKAPGLTSPPAQPAAWPPLPPPAFPQRFGPQTDTGRGCRAEWGSAPAAPTHPGEAWLHRGDPGLWQDGGVDRGHPYNWQPARGHLVPTRKPGRGRTQPGGQPCPLNSGASFWTGFGWMDVAGGEEGAPAGG